MKCFYVMESYSHALVFIAKETLVDIFIHYYKLNGFRGTSCFELLVNAIYFKKLVAYILNSFAGGRKYPTSFIVLADRTAYFLLFI